MHQPNQLKQNLTYRSFSQVSLIVSFYNISSFYFGYAFVYFSSIPYQHIHNMFNVPFSPSVGQGIFTGCLPFGAALGGLFFQIILMHLSRKHTFFFFNGLVLVSGIFVLILNPYTLLIGRILQGICVGAFSGLVPLVVKQISPIQISGTMGAFQNAYICFGFLFGFLLSYILGSFFQDDQYWIIVFSFTLLTTLIQQVLFFTHFTNQTPKYLLIKGKSQQAKKLIDKIYLPQYQQLVYNQKLLDLQIVNHYQETQKQYPSDHWRAIFIAIFLASFQQLSGINIILLYGAQLATGFMPSLSTQFPLFVNVEKMIVSLFTVYLLDRFGRKFLLQTGLVALAITLLVFFIGLEIRYTSPSLSSTLIMLAVLVYILAFVSTFGPIMWLYLPEVIQPNKVPIAVASNWITNSLVVTLFPIIRAGCGDIDCPWVFLVLSGCMGFSFVICKIFMVQTKDKTELQIRQQFNKQVC